MKKLFTLLLSSLLLGGFAANAQVFWTENFESGSMSGMYVTAYSGPNGRWTMSLTGSEGDQPNLWYVSCAEAGHITGACGTTCLTGLGLGATLHIGSSDLSMGDMGATYDAGGLCGFGFYCVNTDRRAESPTINCTGKYGINMKFYYIEDGQLTTDDATVWYSPDNGVSWSLLGNPAKTPPICPGGQGLWQSYTVALPSSADNNANVKIGFRWVNDDDGVGTDPSFAVDSVSLSASPTIPVPSFTVSANPTCQDSCVIFTNTTTGTTDSITWSLPGFTLAHPHGSRDTVCFPVPGSYVMTLTAYRMGTAYTTTTTVTVNPTPHPVVTRTGAVLTVSGTYTTYQWYNGISPITGATTNSYTFPAPGTYTVLVDSAGCKGISTPFTFDPLHTGSLTNLANNYWIATEAGGIVTVNANEPLNENCELSIYDATGRKMKTDTWTSGDFTKRIDAGAFAPGMYIFKLSGGHTSIALRWMKQ